MIRFPTKFFSLAFFLTIAALFAQRITPTFAQEDVLKIVIAQPAEGETFYAGPSSIVYTIPINGRLQGPFDDFAQAEIHLEILQGTQLVNSAQTEPFPDGAFTFYVTVNPEASQGDFTAELKECEFCHRTTELNLPPGFVTLRFSALLLSGESATAERHIFVDHSKYAVVPVQVYYQDNPQQPAPNIPVSGSTWLYLWRARHFSGTTDEAGQAMLSVEALTQAPTRYAFYVEPVVIDGVLYESVDPVEITLPANAQNNATITLYVQTSKGEISGNLLTESIDSAGDITIYVIPLPIGKPQQTLTDSNGYFFFPEMALGEYLLTPDRTVLSSQNLQTKSTIVDLKAEPQPHVRIDATQLSDSSLVGMVTEAGGSPLPFAWISIGENANAETVIPWTGQWMIDATTAEKASVWIHAPGYYSQVLVVEEGSEAIRHIDAVLQRRSDTKSISWGEGEIVVPPETIVTLHDYQLLIDKGWLWGTGEDIEPKVIKTATTEITLHEGTFALEIPPRGTSWFYLFSGKAELLSLETGTSIMLEPGEMVALNSDQELSPIPQDTTVFYVFHPESAPPITPTWERSISAVIRDSFARVGIGAAQIVTIITYITAIALLISTPLVSIRWWWKHKRKNPY